MKKRMLTAMLAALLLMMLATPALAADGPELLWLDAVGTPRIYNVELNLLTVYDEDLGPACYDLSTGERVADYNAVWRDLAEELGVFYVAVDEMLTGEDGCLPADLNFDGVHLNPDGCAVWLEYLRTHAVADLELNA